MISINDYWSWLEDNFVKNLRAQRWYNGDEPRNLSGFISDQSSRLMGWSTMRQLRIRSGLFISSLCRLTGDVNVEMPL
jgi:hypothetical protein